MKNPFNPFGKMALRKRRLLGAGPEAEDGERPDPVDNFNTAVEAICNAAAKFKEVAGGVESESAYVSGDEGDPYAGRVPVSAYCLRLAHDLWRETVPPYDTHGVMGQIAAMTFGGGLRPARPDDFVNLISDLAEVLSPEQRAESVAAIQSFDDAADRPTKEKCPDCGHATGGRPGPAEAGMMAASLTDEEVLNAAAGRPPGPHSPPRPDNPREVG